MSNTKTSHAAIQKWVADITALCTPDAVEWCYGSQAEWDRLTSLMVEKGTFTRLNPEGPREGEATAVEARVNLRELGWTQRDWSAGAWWRSGRHLRLARRGLAWPLRLIAGGRLFPQRMGGAAARQTSREAL